MGKISRDFKGLITGEDGSNHEPEDFKTEVAKSVETGLITKPEGALLIATKINVDKKGAELVENQEKDVKKINQDEVYNSLEEELSAKKEKEEKERKRKERESEIARQMAEKTKKKTSTGGTSKKMEHDEKGPIIDKIRE